MEYGWSTQLAVSRQAPISKIQPMRLSCVHWWKSTREIKRWRSPEPPLASDCQGVQGFHPVGPFPYCIVQGSARWDCDHHYWPLEYFPFSAYRIQVTGCSNSFHLREYTGRLGPTQHELFRADWVKTRQRSWILSSDWLNVKPGYEVTHRYMGGLVPLPGFHTDWPLITWHVREVWAFSAGAYGIRIHSGRYRTAESVSTRGVISSNSEQMSQDCLKNYSFRTLVTKLPCTTFAILTHSWPSYLCWPFSSTG